MPSQVNPGTCAQIIQAVQWQLGIKEALLRLVSRLSVRCDWVRLKPVWQHVRISELHRLRAMERL